MEHLFTRLYKYSPGAGEEGCYQLKEGKHPHCLLVLTVSEMCDFDISKYLSFGHEKKKICSHGNSLQCIRAAELELPDEELSLPITVL